MFSCFRSCYELQYQFLGYHRIARIASLHLAPAKIGMKKILCIGIGQSFREYT